MRKIGIVTHYYNSVNYGGVLQAYALCRFLNDKGYFAEQICVDKTSNGRVVKRALKNILEIIRHCFHFNEYKNINKRKKAFVDFRENSIPHTSTVYKEDDLCIISEKYDIFITGSDQVWHPNAVCNAYLLDFPSSKRKISYAASVATEELSDMEKEKYRKALKKFSAISVREKNGVSLIQPLVSLPVYWVVDPVFLLTKNEWKSIKKDRIIETNGKYIFSFFLGGGEIYRNLTKEFAQLKKLKIVTLPYLENDYRHCDKDFGDVKLFDVSPKELLSLIEGAEYVFTDSFHVTAFSIIFEKQFFVFERNSSLKMESRIYSLTDLFNLNNRFFNNMNVLNIEQLLNIEDIVYKNKQKDFYKMKQKSIDFLMQNIE